MQRLAHEQMHAVGEPGVPERPTTAAAAPDLSIVVPVFNEAESVPPLVRELTATLAGLPYRYEILLIDDGSTDATWDQLAAMAAADRRVRPVRFARNYGQTAALMAGFDLSLGDLIITLDGDGQNDPADIQALLAKLNEGYDVVSGWRRTRRDGASRVLVSQIANRIISAFTGVRLNDYGCTLKVYRRSALEGIRLYGEMHRFIPIFASWQGARVAQMAVNHRPRTTGKSKYGFGRTSAVIVDLMLVLFLERAANRPMHLFGGLGLASIAGGLAAGLWAIWLKLFSGVPFITTPLPLLVVMLMVLGIVCILSGLLAEMLMRTYHESQDKKPYSVREIRNATTDD